LRGNWWLELGFWLTETLGQSWGCLKGNWWLELRFWVMEALGYSWGCLGGGGLGCTNKVLGEGMMGADLGVWGLNSRVRKPLLNLVLLLDEIPNMKPNGNEKKVMICYKYLE